MFSAAKVSQIIRLIINYLWDFFKEKNNAPVPFLVRGRSRKIGLRTSALLEPLLL